LAPEVVCGGGNDVRLPPHLAHVVEHHCHEYHDGAHLQHKGDVAQGLPPRELETRKEESRLEKEQEKEKKNQQRHRVKTCCAAATSASCSKYSWRAMTSWMRHDTISRYTQLIWVAVSCHQSPYRL